MNFAEALDTASIAEIEEALDFAIESEGEALQQAAAAYLRRPEDEIYGRSLTTIHRLGAFMVRKSLRESIDSPEAAQARAEFYTSVEEGFGTDRELGGGLEVRDFDVRQVINGKVTAKDLKTAVSSMTADGLTCAMKAVIKDERFMPQLKRSKWDHENALIVDKMARGETTYNTRIVVSPFPEEGAAESGDAYWRNIGYVPHLKRGFVQLYHMTESGTLLAGSLSFDGSNKQKLREVFGKYGIEIPEDEITDNWLQYALTDTLPAAEAKAMATQLADELGQGYQNKNTNTIDVTREFGPLVDAVFNGSYIHICESLFRGRQTPGTTQLILQLTNQAQHFNERYQKALYRMRVNRDNFTDDDVSVLHDLLVYSTIEMMRALHLSKTQQVDAFPGGLQLTAQSLQSMDEAAFQAALSGFGAEGARNNRGYSACGTEIFAGAAPSSDGSPQTAFGGIDRESSGKKLMSCPFCKAKVFEDPCATVLACRDCKARVVNGRVVNKGDGGSRARAAALHEKEAARERERKEREAAMAKQVEEAFEEMEVAAIEAQERPQAGNKMGQLALTTAGV